MTFRFLLTATGGAMSPLTIRCLKNSVRHDILVIAVDARADAAGRYFADIFEVVPPGDDPAYVDALGAVAEKHGADLILPCSDEEALALAAAAARFQNDGPTLACAPLDVLCLMANKPASYRGLEEAGIDTPAWREAGDREELEAAIGEMARCGDIVVKPAGGRGGRGVFVIRKDISGAHPYNDGREVHLDFDSFRRNYTDKACIRLPLLIMERLYPPAYDIDVLARQGELLRVVPRRRLNPAGIPFKGGVIENSKRLLDLAEKIVRAIGLSWLCDFDIMMNREGEPRVLELNPRPSGSIAAAVEAGMPILDDLVSLAKGESLPPAELPDQVMVVPYMSVKVIQP
ncbi:MAG: ATP-grasp domain-containing protein [Proteobacteria bacterium]|nr:ATP-grasp domain-containing protein [Pseudomonadota bacterium]